MQSKGVLRHVFLHFCFDSVTKAKVPILNPWADVYCSIGITVTIQVVMRIIHLDNFYFIENVEDSTDEDAPLNSPGSDGR